MRWFIGSIVVLSVAGAIWQGSRHHVPAYKKWGSHSKLCNTTGPAGDTDDFEDPIAAFTSLLFLTASVDDDIVVGVAGILASASFMLHAFETEHSRELDFSVAAGLPLFLAISAWPVVLRTKIGSLKGPTLASFLLGLFIVLQYESIISDYVVFGIGAGILLGTLFLKSATRYQWLGLILSGLGAGFSIGGDRNTAICNDDRQLAFVYDARHSTWHVNAALLLWQAIGILKEKERRLFLQCAVVGLIPLIARAIDLYKVYFAAWVTVFSLSIFFFIILILIDARSPSKIKGIETASFGMDYKIFS